MMSHVCFIAIVVTLAVSAWAQTISTSEVKGIVQDSMGRSVPYAEIKLTQTNTGAMRMATTSQDGSYLLPELPVGPYRLEVAKPGFSTYVQTGFVLQVASNSTIDVTLTVGSVSETINVEGDAAMVQTRRSGVGQVIEPRQILELPLIGRNVTDLIFLSGAATLSTNPQLNSSRNYSTPAISLAGGVGSGTTYVLDGSMHNDPSNSLALPLPFPDALEEFKVETGALPAQYGLHSAGAVNAVTRSGTNELHGDAFWFVRNYRFNARNFFAAERDSLKRNQFGGTLGGPVMKNRLFAFGGYQGTTTRQNAITNTMFIPTDAALHGDFTALASAACNGGIARVLRAPFVQNQVAPSLLSKPALNLAAKLPSTADLCGRITFGVANISDDRQAVAKADYQVNSRHALFGRYLAANFVAPNPYSLTPNVLATSATNGASYGQDILAQSATLGHTWVAASNGINSFRATFNRSSVERVGGQFFSGPDLGINMHTYFPKYLSIIATGSFAVGERTSTDANYHTNTYQLADDFNLVRGGHQMSLGVNAARWRAETFAGVFGAGVFTFSGGVTGSTLADLLLGNAASFQQGAPAGLFVQQHYIGLYAQDSWRLRRGLTLNYGIRWEPNLPQQVEDGHISHIDLNAFLEGRHTTVYRNAPNGIFYPGDPGFPSRSSINPSWRQFAPRLGVAWDPNGNGRLSVRVSYGIFYEVLPEHIHLNTIAANPWVGRLTVTGVNFANPWENQLGGDPFPLPPFSSASPFVPGGTFVNWQYNMRPMYVQTRNITVQKQIAANWLVSASYLGNQSTHLLSPQAFNPAIFLGNTSQCTINGVVINGCNTTGSTAERRKLTLLNPSQGRFFGDVIDGDSGGTGNYNGMLLSVQRRLSRRVGLNANYTWSHCISDYVFDAVSPAGQTYTNPEDRGFDRGNCNTSASDRRHIVNVAAITETPGFAGRWYGQVARGWRLSTIITGQSGPWLNVTTGSIDSALSGISNQRANQIAPNIYGSGFRQYLNASPFALPASGTLGNLGAGSIAGPGYVTVNLGLFRSFRVRERQTLEFRAEGSNLLNTVNFGNPNTSVGTSTFGQITSTAGGTGAGFVAPGDPRILQFALKYIF